MMAALDMSCQVDPMHNAMQLSQPVPLNSKLWSNCLICNRGDPASILDGTCSMRPQGDNRLLYTPAHHPQVRHTLGRRAGTTTNTSHLIRLTTGGAHFQLLTSLFLSRKKDRRYLHGGGYFFDVSSYTPLYSSGEVWALRDMKD